jgi:superfamily II DNA helicase RecQ
VLELAGRDGCQTAMLAEHFGERLAEACGHCTWCCNCRQPVKLLPRRETRRRPGNDAKSSPSSADGSRAKEIGGLKR